MIILFIVLEVLDLATTVIALGLGLKEGNPFMAALTIPEMAVWKMLATGIIAFLVWKGWIHKLALYIGNPIVALVVVNNLIALSGV